MKITYNDLYLEIRQKFQEAGYPGAALEARELVCCVSRKTQQEFFRDAREPVPAETQQQIRTYAGRHLDGEPVPYLIGEWDFYGLTLHVSRDVLIPRTDTEILAEEAIQYLRTLGPCRVLDLCAGSGCVGLAVAANVPDCQVLLGELSEKAIQICRRNIQRCGLSERVSVRRMDALLKPPKPVSAGEFQCILCNPPYIPKPDLERLDRSVRDFEPQLALCGGADGLDFYRAVSRLWRDALDENGRLYYEVGIGQADIVTQIMRSEGFGELRCVPDSRNIPRVVYGTKENSVWCPDFRTPFVL
ncbi:MAG: peptide chain release factor N(5)-glutamine methyltransferase [Oscillospiraceae bacterium]|nr:peptide chain release factor N(5)-glutamine methyltransferase [Oscillospiraceae bacterium]